MFNFIRKILKGDRTMAYTYDRIETISSFFDDDEDLTSSDLIDFIEGTEVMEEE
jgi:hypothetical protein